jgi:hypothetical protein
MKTIQVEDAMYEQLLALASEIATQDNRATARPYLFQIRTDRKVWVGNLNGDHKMLLSNDRDEIGPFDANTVEEYCKDHELEVPDWVPALRSGMVSHWDYEDWITERGLFLESYSIAHDLKNGFLTAKGCQEHIKANAHHYDNPTDYLSHAGRNTELDLVFRFLGSLVEREKEPKPRMGVNFDGLRTQTVQAYNRIVEEMNNSNLQGLIHVIPRDIQEDMDHLRHCLVTLTCLMREGEFGYLDLKLEQFNPEADDDY